VEEGVLAPPTSASSRLVSASPEPVRIAATYGTQGILWVTGTPDAPGSLLSLRLASSSGTAVPLVTNVPNLSLLSADGEQYCWGSPGTSAESYQDGFVTCLRPGGGNTFAAPAAAGLSQSGNRVTFATRRVDGRLDLESLDLSQFLDATTIPRTTLPHATSGLVSFGTSTRSSGEVVFVGGEGEVAALFLSNEVTPLGGAANGQPVTRAEVASNTEATVVCTGAGVVLYRPDGRSRTLSRTACGQVGLRGADAYFPFVSRGRHYLARATHVGYIQLLVETKTPARALAVQPEGAVYFGQDDGVHVAR